MEGLQHFEFSADGDCTIDQKDADFTAIGKKLIEERKAKAKKEPEAEE